MLTTSQNGWPVSDNPSDLGLVPLVVGGVSFGGGVRGGKVHQALSYVANAVHTRVQKANATYGCWGYAYRENTNSPGEWSNHASGTAIDFNATLHGNGLPTTETWTDAQIAEIHKILDEVGGIVRWGGDYQSTPDSMHFEVVVPPSQLGEDVIIPAASSLWPIGNPDFQANWRATPELTTMSVSYPTMAAYAQYGEASWFFRPTVTGRLSFDALLSHWMDDKLNESRPVGPQVYLTLYEATYAPAQDGWVLNYKASSSYFSGAFGLPERWQGRFVYEVTAGKTYVIKTYADQDYPYVRTVVRIGDYAPQPEWVQPPDQEYIYGQFGANRLPSGPGGAGVDMGPWSTGVGFEGSCRTSRSFGGPYPGTQPDAVACTWKYARRVKISGFFWWGPNGSGDWGNGGYGTCPVFTFQDVNSSQGYSDWPVGYHYYSEAPITFFGYSDQQWRVFATSCSFDPQESVTRAGQTGMGTGWNAPAPTYLPELEGAEYIEWESATSSLAALYWSWDETNGGGTAGSGVIVKWYMGKFDELEDWTSGRWGPFGLIWYGDAMGEDAASWAATQEHLGDTAGGYSNWYPVPENLWNEKIRFTALPGQIFSNQVPDMGQDIYGTGISIYKYRSGQYMAIRALIRPSRYRVVPDPGIEDLEWAGVGAIAMKFDDSGKVLY